MLFVLLLLIADRKVTVSEELKPLLPFLGVIAMGAYLLYYHAVVVDARDEFLAGTNTATGFIFHYVMIALLLTSVMISLKKFNDIPELAQALRQTHWWFYIFFFVFVASAELDHIVMLTAFEQDNGDFIINQTHRIGFPILWGFTSFTLIAIGLKQKIKMLRIISLVLLLITLLKLFLFDIRDISEGGKIAAFISLGVMLLVVSFMYQRLKKLLLEDTTVK